LQRVKDVLGDDFLNIEVLAREDAFLRKVEGKRAGFGFPGEGEGEEEQ
jgi:hypothetical protein